MTERKPSFQDLAHDPQRSLVAETWDYLKVRKKWWLLPIVVTFGLLALLMVLSSTAAAPFIYTLF